MKSLGQRRRDNPRWHMVYAITSLDDVELVDAYKSLKRKISTAPTGSALFDTWLLVAQEFEHRFY